MAATAIRRTVLGAAAALILGGTAFNTLPADAADASLAPRVIEVERYSRTTIHKDPYGGTDSVTCWYDSNHRQVGSCLVK
jgi:hypothetical protein